MKRTLLICLIGAGVPVLVGFSSGPEAAPAVQEDMTFFLTSRGPGDGANLGGLDGADAHCAMLAGEAGAASGLTWQAYLSTTGDGGMNAKDRIGDGPWHNANGVMVAKDVADLHSDSNMLSKENSVSEKGEVISGRGDDVNRHDIITGTGNDGMMFMGDGDTTCGNWMSSAGDGSARVGHHDRTGGGDDGSSWTSAHASRGCGQADLQGTGGDGLFYCFGMR